MWTRLPEAQAQIAWADTVIMTQTDLASTQQIDRIGARLDHLAPAAIRLTAVQGAFEPNALLNFPMKFRRLRDTERPGLPDHGFSSIPLQLENRLPWKRLKKALEYLVAHYPEELVRIKGKVYTPGQNEPLLVQATTGRLYPATRLPVRTSDDGIRRLVIITHSTVKGLAEDLMAQLRS